MRIFLILILTPFFVKAQTGILNGSFENWANGKPDHWLTSNAGTAIVNVTQTDDANTGSSAVRGEVVEIFNAPTEPGIFSGKDNTLFENPFLAAQNYQKFSGYYKFILGNPSPSDIPLDVVVTLTNNTQGRRVAEAEAVLLPTDVYTYFEIPFVYDDPVLDAEVVHVSISIGGNPDGDHNIGSVFFMDDLSLDGVTAIEKLDTGIPHEFKLKQNYPNPFNPSTTFSFSVPTASEVSLKIFNLAGEQVAEVLNERLAAGEYSMDWNADDLSSGIYIYRLIAGNQIFTRRMVLIK